jgi:signal peptidase I
MAKSKSSKPDAAKAAKAEEPKPADGAATDTKPKPKRKDGTRETVESIVVAFILAFLFRTYEAEAFVIPTGSMAPTLYGRHKDVECPQCGTHFAIGASDELGPIQRPENSRGDEIDAGLYNPLKRIETAFCPNCRYETPVRDLPVFTGDRILVNKWPYEFGDPERWDVVVFKYPEDPKINYIKRLVGLPGDEISVERGDVYARGPNGERRILRKDDPNKQRELQIAVYDDRHPPRELIAAGWPERWGGVRPEGDEEAAWVDDPAGWRADRDGRRYELDTAADDWTWLRYRHFLPAPADWQALPDVSRAPRPELITDFLAYNVYTGGGPKMDVDLVDGEFWAGYWVGDLTLEGCVRVERAEGALLLELNEGFRRYRCTIDLATGTAELSHLEDGIDLEGAVETPLARASTRMKSTGTYDVAFANVDERLVLWINGSIVPFDADTTYAPAQLPGPHRRDVAPAGIALRGSHVVVDRLRILRDVYYRAEKTRDDVHDFDLRELPPDAVHELARLRADPDRWADVYNAAHRTVTFAALGEDEFFMMGDNSARSADSRLWRNDALRIHRHAVARSALVGKAFFVYWPHGVPFGNDGKGYSGFARNVPGLNRFFYHQQVNEGIGPGAAPGKVSDYPKFSIPFYPQFGRMSRIR